MTRPPVTRLPLLPLAVPFVIWSSSFVALYAAAAIGCALAFEEIAVGPASGLRLLLVGLWLVHLSAFVPWLGHVERRMAREAADDPGRFAAITARTAAIAGAVATVWTGLPVLLPTACA